MRTSIHSVENRVLAQPLETWTEDLSANGVLLEMEDPLLVGTRLNVTIRFPAAAIGRAVHLRCNSRVVRVASLPEGPARVAAVIDSYEFLPA